MGLALGEGLSRRRHGFESRCDCQESQGVRSQDLAPCPFLGPARLDLSRLISQERGNEQAGAGCEGLIASAQAYYNFTDDFRVRGVIRVDGALTDRQQPNRTSAEFTKALGRRRTVFASAAASPARDDYDRFTRLVLGWLAS